MKVEFALCESPASSESSTASVIRGSLAALFFVTRIWTHKAGQLREQKKKRRKPGALASIISETRWLFYRLASSGRSRKLYGSEGFNSEKRTEYIKITFRLSVFLYIFLPTFQYFTAIITRRKSRLSFAWTVWLLNNHPSDPPSRNVPTGRANFSNTLVSYPVKKSLIHSNLSDKRERV